MKSYSLDNFKALADSLVERNLVASCYDRIYRLNLAPEDLKKDLAPIAGSHISKKGVMVKALPGWDRPDIAVANAFANWEDLVPCRPKGHNGWDSWVYSLSPNQAWPQLLQLWGKDRLVFELDTEVPTFEESIFDFYLGQIPFESFMLRLTSPFSVTDPLKNSPKFYDTVLVTRTASGVFCITIVPDATGISPLTKKQRNKITSFLSYCDDSNRLKGFSKGKREKIIKQLMKVVSSFLSKQASCFRFFVSSEGALYRNYADCIKKTNDPWRPADGSAIKRAQFKYFAENIFENVNSFAYGFLTFREEVEAALEEPQLDIHPKDTLPGSSPDTEASDLKNLAEGNLKKLHALGFFDIPVSSVITLTRTKRKGRQRPSLGFKGCQKIPHPRSPTTRRNKRADGSVYVSPVRGSIVHAERFRWLFGVGAYKKARIVAGA